MISCPFRDYHPCEHSCAHWCPAGWGRAQGRGMLHPMEETPGLAQDGSSAARGGLGAQQPSLPPLLLPPLPALSPARPRPGLRMAAGAGSRGRFLCFGAFL